MKLETVNQKQVNKMNNEQKTNKQKNKQKLVTYDQIKESNKKNQQKKTISNLSILA